MKILGVDPGLATSGFGVIDGGARARLVECGALHTRPGTPEAERLRTIFDGMGRIIERHRPDVLAIEQLFFNKNIRSAMAVAQARGVVLLAAAAAGLTVHELTPLQVKLAVTGQGRATKEQVGYMVKALLSLDHIPKPDDVADALAVAIACGQTAETDRRWRAASREAAEP